MAEVAYFQEVAENMMVVAHYYLTEEGEVVEGSKEEAGLAAKGHIPRAAMAFVKVFGSDRMDHFHMIVRKEEN